jgi:hypothetical protein
MTKHKVLIISTILVVLSALLFSAYLPDNTVNISDKTQKNKTENLNIVTPPRVPDKIDFAGEQVPLGNYDVYEGVDRELIVNCYFHSQTFRLIKLMPRYFNIIEPILKENKIPDDFKYLAIAESGLNPRAVSPAGAVGLWQFMESTAKDYGLEVNSEIDERYHIEKATHAACAYLHESYEKYGNWTMVAASYNAGRTGIDKQIEIQKQNDYYDLLLNAETGRYVYRILALKTILSDYEKYGFEVSKKDQYPVIPCKTIEVNGAVADFADFALEHGINYKILKDFNPWLRQPKLQNKNGKTYQIKIPKGKYRSF